MPATEADLAVVLMIHDAIRRDLGGFASRPADEPSEGGRTYWNHTLGQLHHHHEVEDDQLWPILRERDSSEAEAVTQRMETQHQGVAQLLEALARDEASFAREPHRVGQLADLVERHLDDEEETAFPVVLSLMSSEELAAFGQRQIMEMQPEQLAFFMPWILYEAPSERADFFRSVLPPPLVEALDQQMTPSFLEARRAAFG